jgi:hypothetical protein
VDPDIQRKADLNFEAVLRETGARDPRELYRELLRQLRERDEAAYSLAVERWQSEVVEPIADGADDPLSLWLRFGLALAAELHPGRSVEIDETGRVRDLELPPSWTRMLLHLPESARKRAVPVCLPPEMSGPQEATLVLLVEGKLRLSEGG